MMSLLPNPHGLMATRVNDTNLTCQAVAVIVANTAYTAAMESALPAKSLDDMADALPEILPEILGVAHVSPEDADALRGYIADRLWACTAIEHARIEAGDGYGYIFDLLADNLSHGADPHTIRTDALAAPRRIRAITEAGA